MIVFDDFCRNNQIVHFREAFYHFLMSRGKTIVNEPILRDEWDIFLTRQMATRSDVVGDNREGDDKTNDFRLG